METCGQLASGLEAVEHIMSLPVGLVPEAYVGRGCGRWSL